MLGAYFQEPTASNFILQALVDALFCPAYALVTMCGVLTLERHDIAYISVFLRVRAGFTCTHVCVCVLHEGGFLCAREHMPVRIYVPIRAIACAVFAPVSICAYLHLCE